MTLRPFFTGLDGTSGDVHGSGGRLCDLANLCSHLLVLGRCFLRWPSSFRVSSGSWSMSGAAVCGGWPASGPGRLRPGGSMRHWQPDRSTIKGPGIRQALFLSHSDLRKCVKIHPAYIPRPATYGGSWLHLAAAEGQVTTRGWRHMSAVQAWFYQVERRAWDSNPRARSPLLAVFKTAAIGH